ncbi:hypothetical protein U0070_010246 [Myodes glareolus]|uniref:60S ribosomal protein L7a n=1 Tax=Myodes glareolus TaxID=447135 RepID=A0AAW0H4H9_MYOGA
MAYCAIRMLYFAITESSSVVKGIFAVEESTQRVDSEAATVNESVVPTWKRKQGLFILSSVLKKPTLTHRPQGRDRTEHKSHLALKAAVTMKRAWVSLPKARGRRNLAQGHNNFNIGQDIQSKRDLTCFAKWSHPIGLQWQRAIFYKWLQVPSSIYQFPQMPKLAHKYRPETQLPAHAEKRAASKGGILTKRSPNYRAGPSMVTTQGRTIITHTVDPIERVFFLHTLCHKLRLPYCIIKRKAGLGSWSTGRHAPLLPSLRLARKTKVLWLSLWKLSGPIALTDTKRSMSVRGNVLG